MEALGVRFPHAMRHRSARQRIEPLGPESLASDQRHVCFRRGRHRQWGIPRGARSVRGQTALRHPIRKRVSLQLRDATSHVHCVFGRRDRSGSPGHFIIDKTTPGPFSIWPADCRGAMPDRSAKALDRLVRSAVHSRIPPDLPFALMFSGGIDSTLVAHYAREIRPEAPGYFLGDDAAPDYPYAARYADQSGLELRRVPLGDLSKKDVSRLEQVVAVAESFEPAVIRDALCNYALFSEPHSRRWLRAPRFPAMRRRSCRRLSAAEARFRR